MTYTIVLSSGQKITSDGIMDFGVCYEDDTLWFVDESGVVDDYPLSEVKGVEIYGF